MGTFRRMDGSLITNEIHERPDPDCCSGEVLCPACVSQLTVNADDDAGDDDDSDVVAMNPFGHGFDEIFPSDEDDDVAMATDWGEGFTENATPDDEPTGRRLLELCPRCTDLLTTNNNPLAYDRRLHGEDDENDIQELTTYGDEQPATYEPPHHRPRYEQPLGNQSLTLTNLRREPTLTNNASPPDDLGDPWINAMQRLG